jgi:hypothetical protein
MQKLKCVFVPDSYAKDLAEIGNQLLKMACDPHNASEWAAGEKKIWENTKRGFGAIAEYANIINHIITLSYFIHKKIISVIFPNFTLKQMIKL